MSSGNSNTTKKQNIRVVKGGGEMIDLEDGTGGVNITVQPPVAAPAASGKPQPAATTGTIAKLQILGKYMVGALVLATVGFVVAVVVVSWSWSSGDPSPVPPPATVAPTPTVAPTVPTTGAPTFRVALTENSQLTASDGNAWDRFGVSVALEGNTLVVGAGFDDYVMHVDSGSAYVYTRSSNGAWTLQAQLKAKDWDRGDQFGRCVAISGNTIVVGNPHDDQKGIASGSTYVYTRQGTTWTKQAKLTAFDGAAFDYFGTSVAIDGNTIVVGAYQDSDLGPADGSVYVYTRTGTTWKKQAKLRARDGAAHDNFGGSVAIAGDTIVVGASRVDNDNGTNSGATYVYLRTANYWTEQGFTWTEQAKLTASDGAAGDQFGRSLAIDGDTIVVGSNTFVDGPGTVNCGSAFVAIVVEDWVPGGSGCGITKGGSAHVFLRTGTTWTEQAKLTASDGAANEQFGISVAIDGDTIVVGAGLDNDSGSGSGSAHVFTNTGTTWSQQGQLTASGVASFGISVAIAGDTVGVGAHFAENGRGTQTGSAFVYDLN